MASSIDLLGGTGANTPYDSYGLPVLLNAIAAFGQLKSELSGTQIGSLQYTINSITLAPLPASAGLMLSGLGLLGVMLRRRRTR